VNLTEWARSEGVHPQTAYRWFREGTLPVPAVRVNQRTVLVNPGSGEAPVVRVEAEVGSGMNGARPEVRRLLADPQVSTVVVEHRDRLGPMNTELAEATLSAPVVWAPLGTQQGDQSARLCRA
jgi:putative resolvase